MNGVLAISKLGVEDQTTLTVTRDYVVYLIAAQALVN